MKKRNITLLTAFAAAAALAPAVQAEVTLSDNHTGDYRIIFVTLEKFGAVDTAIGPYNAFVTAQAALSGSTETKDLATTWTAVGSTGATSARVNTGTTGAGTDIHIYTPSGTAGEYTLVATSYDALWNAASVDLLAPIRYGDGSLSDESNGGGDQIWTGTQSNGSSEPVGVDGSYLGSGFSGDQTATNITLARGGKVNKDWIEGPSDHDGTIDTDFQPHKKHFMGMSGVISGTTPAADPEITSIVKSGNTVGVEFTGAEGGTFALNKAAGLDGTFPDNEDSTPDSVTIVGTSGTLTDTNADEGGTLNAAFYQVKQQP